MKDEFPKDFFKLITKMPKGGLLHAHMEVTGTPSVLLKMALNDEDLYYNPKDDTLKLFVNKEMIDENYINVFKNKYKENMPEIIKNSLYYTRKDADNANHWSIFQYKIDNMIGIQNTTKYLKEHVLDALNSSIDEGILIFQGRIVLGHFRDYDTDENVSVEKELDVYLEAYEEVKKREPKFQFHIIKLIIRNNTEECIKKNLEKFLELKSNEKYRDILLGYDLVGDELLQKSEEFSHILEEYQKKNPNDLVFYLHAGESNLEENDNVFDNLILGGNRIGHGINLIKHSYLFEEFKKRKICIESCPLSNQILNYTPDLRHHPLKTYLNYGLRVTISSDDNLLFNTSIINEDFYVCGVLMDFTLLDYKQVCYNSIVGSGLDSKIIDDVLKLWELRWETFCSDLANGNISS